jgi:hypothetical protein
MGESLVRFKLRHLLAVMTAVALLIGAAVSYLNYRIREIHRIREIAVARRLAEVAEERRRSDEEFSPAQERMIREMSPLIRHSPVPIIISAEPPPVPLEPVPQRGQ